MQEFFNRSIFSSENFSLTVGKLLFIGLLVIVLLILLGMVKRILTRYSSKTESDRGRYHSIFLLIKYFAWFFLLMIILDIVGFKLTIFLAGGAALLVGIGIGLQNIFSDFISGIFLLFEGTLAVDDIIEVDGVVGRVTRFSLRNTQVFTRDEYYLIIPNHKFVTGNIVNWSHVNRESRYHVSVSVQYGSDTGKVIEILEECTLKFEGIVRKPKPFARFENFGDSALEFKLYFFSAENFYIERIKGNLRLEIDKQFRAKGITVPFPQRDIHIKSDLTK